MSTPWLRPEIYSRIATDNSRTTPGQLPDNSRTTRMSHGQIPESLRMSHGDKNSGLDPGCFKQFKTSGVEPGMTRKTPDEPRMSHGIPGWATKSLRTTHGTSRSPPDYHSGTLRGPIRGSGTWAYVYCQHSSQTHYDNRERWETDQSSAWCGLFWSQCWNLLIDACCIRVYMEYLMLLWCMRRYIVYGIFDVIMMHEDIHCIWNI